MPLYPAKTPITVEANSVSPIENFLIRTLFPQTGDEPDIPVNPVSGIAKGAFFKKLRQSLREQAIEQRVRGVLTPREADSLYAEGVKSLEKLKTLPRELFQSVYSVPGSHKRITERARKLEDNAFSKMKWLQEHGANPKSKMEASDKWLTASESINFLDDPGVYGYLLGTKETRQLTGVNRVKGRGILGVTNNPEHNFGETVAHELGHVTSLRNIQSVGKPLSENIPVTTQAQLSAASKSTGVNISDDEELFADIFSYHASGNKAKLDELSKKGLNKQVNFVGNLYRSLAQKRQKAK